MIRQIVHCGKLIDECTLPGETRADDVFPGQANGLPVSANRYLLVYATRGFRGTDDDLSIVAQLRAEAYDGPVLRELMLAKSINDWDPFDDGSRLVRQHGHPVAFGVPKGAVGSDGHPLPSANLFAIKWRVCARAVDSATGRLGGVDGPALQARTQAVEWLQVRLNEAEDDLEVVQPAGLLRQVGYEDGPQFCAADLGPMNQSFVQATPLNAEGTEWADVNHFAGGRLAVLHYRFNARRGVYEWVAMGPPLGGEGTAVGGLSEASLVPYRDQWLIAARRSGEGTIAWLRLATLLGPPADDGTCPDRPRNAAPLTAYACPDGVVRLLSGDPVESPYHNARDPLYLWDIAPDRGFCCGEPQVVFDCLRANVGIPLAQVPRVDFAHLLPHAGGRVQYLVHRVRSKATNDPRKTGQAITPPEKRASAVYYAKIEYDRDLPATWRFGT